MQFSNFGEKFRGNTGIAELMHDLASSASDPTIQYRLGGGNPGLIPAVQATFQQALQPFAANTDHFNQWMGAYSAPQGHQGFISALVTQLNKRYSWGIGPENVVLTNGSQNAFFMLFNLLGGQTSEGYKRILLPMAPEYIGYEDVSIAEPLFVSQKPVIEKLPEQLFKYRLDTQALKVAPDIAAICISRPTNPTGNVLTDNEVDVLDDLARANSIPLIIDNAYGAPFPNVIHVENTLKWHENIILSMSLSKLGMPSARTGIIIARPEVVSAMTQMNAVLNLSPGAMGAGLIEPMVRDGSLFTLCNEQIKPFYSQRAGEALEWFHEYFADLPVWVHKPEGCIFLWMWCPSLETSSMELYRQLKANGVIVVPGDYFFPGLDKSWGHTRECLRINIAGNKEEIRSGLKLIAKTIRALNGKS